MSSTGAARPKETRAERDAAREDVQKKTATIAERDERIASLKKCIAVIESASQASAAAAAAEIPAGERLRLAIAGWRGPPPSPEEDDINQQGPSPPSA